ncbi:MAG: hypothetical protein U1F43_32120 [Myxococcota bacterium]
MSRTLLKTLGVALLALMASCPSIGASRALDEAEQALIEAAPAALPTAPNKARYDYFQAQAFVAEARVRSGHGDWKQAEQWAVRARKAAEAAQRRLLGDAP